jgi:N-acetylglucosamine-6-phosphate deacetylase
MTPQIVLYGRAWTGGAFVENTAVAIQDGRIVGVGPSPTPPAGARSIAGVIVPGFIDVHVHGAAGADFMDATDEAVAVVAGFHARHGTTALALTTLSASHDRIRAAVEAAARASKRGIPGAEICGIHLEGPYINLDRAGAQTPSAIRPPSIHEVEELHAIAPRLRWIMTLAPEIDGALSLIEYFRDRILFSIGHTSATFAETVAALDAGASHFTHLFNAMPPLHHREPGVVGAALDATDATAELIADGIHLHPAILRFVTKVMPHRVALVTDAVRACGKPDGTYLLYDREITLSDGAARLADGTLAGSVLTMARAVKNMVELGGLPLDRVLPLATEVPARILNVAERKGKLQVGFDADVLVLSDRLEVDQVYARGREIAIG